MEYIIKIKKKQKNLFNDKWIWKMAWKDSRHNFSRLFLFVSSIIIGIAALVAINSFNDNLLQDIDDQAKELLGADFYISSNSAFEEEMVDAFNQVENAEMAMDVRFASMVLFKTPSGGTRLVQVVAVNGGFPFYGDVESRPADALERMREGGVALLDESLAVQYEVSNDDSVKLGTSTFSMGGVVKSMPGSSGVGAYIAPSVYISYQDLEATGLIQFGSRFTYRQYFKTETEEEAEEVLANLKPTMKKFGYRDETVSERKEELGEAFSNLYRFFNLLGFVALILGCIGIASSVHIYVQEKKSSVAMLRCLGASGWQAFNIFFIQAVGIGFLGSVIGAFAGVCIQLIIPTLLQEFLPLEVTSSISWLSIGEGILLGLTIAVLFSILPLVNIRKIPPLVVLRSGMPAVKKLSKVRVAVIAAAVLFPLLFAVYQTDSWFNGSIFFLALLMAFISLAAVANLLIWMVKRYFPHNWSFTWRQGFANLFRPNNQTVVMVIVIGLGAFLISTMSLIQNSLLGQVAFLGSEDRPNTVLFDIQPYQKDGVVNLVEEYELPIQQLVPIVTTKLASIKGKSVVEYQKDTTDDIPNWSLTREYRVTYRDSLISSETINKGQLQPQVENEGDSIYVSISTQMAERLDVGIGDEVVFDVQGVPVTTYIGSTREVDWQRIQTNFIFVFPRNVLEKAPQFYVLMTKSESTQSSAAFQQDLVIKYPNVSVIDLTLILDTVDGIMSKVAFVIQFMALFSIATGLVVLAGAVINSKYLRMKENVLLRTIGAVKKQIVSLTLIEYGYLGLFAGLTGILLSLIASWGLSVFFFDIIFIPDFITLAIIWVAVMALTMIIGWLNTRGIISTSPLEVLRREV